jgi:pseudaminic acid synthase
MKIDGGIISDEEAPYVIAEIGASHQGNLDIAIALIAYAAKAGADAVKLQCYTPDTITLDCDNEDFIIKDGPWRGRKLYELYSHAHTPWEWFPELFAAAEGCGITIFSSVFDKTSVDFLEKLGCPAYKIASMEIVDIPLIQYVLTTDKPLIISTGMATGDEISDAADWCNQSGLALLHCVSGYPTEVRNTNLGALIDLKNSYSCQVGISDHSPGWEVPVAATALGATIIEKHIKLYGDNSSEDAGFAIDPGEFEKMCSAVKNIWMAINMSYGERGEESSRQLRRSLYVVEDMRAGEVFTESNVRSIRPAYGLPPKELPKVLGYEAARDIKRGTALSWDLILSS